MWEESNHYQPPPTTSGWKEYTEHKHIYDLLRKLNPEYESPRADILASESLSSLETIS